MGMSTSIERDSERDFVQSLERGLAVLQLFSQARPSVTISEAAALTGLTRATVRRILVTLERLGYVRAEDRRFMPTPRVLAIGYAYLSSMDLWQAAHPFLAELAELSQESCSAAVLDGIEVVYVARVDSPRVVGVSVRVGARVPAYPTSMGRVLLAGLDPAALHAYFAAVRPERLTPHTVTDETALREIIEQVGEQGWSLVDEELEAGLRSIAAPIRDRHDRVVAALTICGHAGRVTAEQLRDELLPPLLAAAKQISDQVKHR
jgi:IclR family transcriptional regulator, pca regulon regulatory protein